MRYYLHLLMAFFALSSVALGGVGESGVSGGLPNVQPIQSYSTISSAVFQDSQAPTGYQQPQMGTGQDFESRLPGGRGSSPSYQPSFESQKMPQSDATSISMPSSSGLSTSAYLSEAPQINGPYRERLTAEDLKLSEPQTESFQPEGSLDFVPATPPSGMVATEEAATGVDSGAWYYPGSVTTRNRFYIQTSRGFRTVAGCGYGGHLPIWAKVASSGNFYVYEWYPGQWSPSVRWWGWTWPGYKRGWFTGDKQGWHILCYHCRDWSNYIYIYVYPGTPYQGQDSGRLGSGYTRSGTMPSGAPTPPDPNAESLMLPDLNLVSQGQTSSPVSSVYPRPTSYRCNEYFVQVWPGRLNTVGSVRYGEWLPLWSKIGRAGNYWSFEWALCGNPSGYYCYPEVKNFGFKVTGWYPTWFRGNKAGWHILCYYCNDWSNYIYIYVWPTT